MTCASRTSRPVRPSLPPSSSPLTRYNQLLTTPPAKHNKYLSRDVELDIDIGADAKDWAAIQATEKLKPVEAELRRVEEAIAEVVSEMEYLRLREQKLRDTNESTNSRVKYFGVGTTWLLVGLWAWQILYLRAYFRYAMAPGRGGVGGWLANGVPGRSILSERGRRAVRGERAPKGECLEFDVNDMGRPGRSSVLAVESRIANMTAMRVSCTWDRCV